MGPICSRFRESLSVYIGDMGTSLSRYRALLEISEAIGAHRRLADFFEELSRSLSGIIRFDGIGVSLYDEEKQTAQLYLLQTGIKSDIPVGQVFQADEAPTASVVRTGSHFYAADLEREERFPAVNAILRRHGIRSYCVLPLLTARARLGGLHFGSSSPDAYSDEDIEFMRQAARPVSVALENVLAYRRIEELNRRLEQENLYLADEIRSNYFFDEIIGDSPALQKVLRQAEIVAPLDSTVLICGETGTGKEQIARAIHGLSARRRSTFVKLNCAAIPTGLMESEMFGHERGAFTGAISQRIGRFELAHGGTLFLDEVGEIPLDLQPKLLRVLQEHEFEHLGSARTLNSDARMIAATNRDLLGMVQEGEFRADLFYRLNVFPITLPALRERASDIPLLVRHFAQQVSRRMGKKITTIPTDTMEKLAAYSWPGNIRELQNLIERAVILSTGELLQVPMEQLKVAGAAIQGQTLAQAERRHILDALHDTNWIVGGPHGAAARLGMKRSTLQSRMAKLGITRPQ
jgi:formate hydrogenlyase transcriptional activator